MEIITAIAGIIVLILAYAHFHPAKNIVYLMLISEYIEQEIYELSWFHIITIYFKTIWILLKRKN